MTASGLQLKAVWSAQPLIFKPGLLPGETTCWEIPQPRRLALLPAHPPRPHPVQSWRRRNGSGLAQEGRRPKSREYRTKSAAPGVAQRVAPPHSAPGFRLLSGTGRWAPERCVGPLAAGVGTNSTRFSKFGNHNALQFVLALWSKSNFRKQKAS